MKTYNQTKITGLFAMAVAFSVMSCKEETHKVETVPSSEKEVIVMPPPPPPPPAAVIPPPPPVEKPTSISLDKNGVKVKTEKVDVKVGK